MSWYDDLSDDDIYTLKYNNVRFPQLSDRLQQAIMNAARGGVACHAYGQAMRFTDMSPCDIAQCKFNVQIDKGWKRPLKHQWVDDLTDIDIIKMAANTKPVAELPMKIQKAFAKAEKESSANIACYCCSNNVVRLSVRALNNLYGTF